MKSVIFFVFFFTKSGDFFGMNFRRGIRGVGWGVGNWVGRILRSGWNENEVFYLVSLWVPSQHFNVATAVGQTSHGYCHSSRYSYMKHST